MYKFVRFYPVDAANLSKKDFFLHFLIRFWKFGFLDSWAKQTINKLAKNIAKLKKELYNFARSYGEHVSMFMIYPSLM